MAEWKGLMGIDCSCRKRESKWEKGRDDCDISRIGKRHQSLCIEYSTLSNNKYHLSQEEN